MGMLRLSNMRGSQVVRPRLTWDSSNTRLKLQTKVGSASAYSTEKLQVEGLTVDSAMAAASLAATGAVSSKSLTVSSAAALTGIASASSGAASGGGLYYDASGFVKRRA
jgi:hypothetical protein